jgi:cysteinyl-tRNA synthetase
MDQIIEQVDTSVLSFEPSQYSMEYKWEVFTVWFRNGRPTAPVLINQIGYDEFTKNKISVAILGKWVREFKIQAAALDTQINNQLERRLVAEKIEMLNKHAQLGQDIQQMAMDYIEAHKDDLKVPNAVKLLIEGVRIERESRGIPQALDKMANKSDEELLKEIANIISKSPAYITSVDDE